MNKYKRFEWLTGALLERREILRKLITRLLKAFLCRELGTVMLQKRMLITGYFIHIESISFCTEECEGSSGATVAPKTVNFGH